MVVVCTFRRLCSLRDEVYSPPKHKARRASGESLTLTCKRQVTWSGKTPKLGHVGARVGAVSRRVLSVKPGSPAALAGLQCFDRVLCVGSATLDANTTFDDAWQHSLKATLKVERPSKVDAAEGAALLRSICEDEQVEEPWVAAIVAALCGDETTALARVGDLLRRPPPCDDGRQRLAAPSSATDLDSSTESGSAFGPAPVAPAALFLPPPPRASASAAPPLRRRRVRAHEADIAALAAAVRGIACSVAHEALLVELAMEAGYRDLARALLDAYAEGGSESEAEDGDDATPAGGAGGKVRGGRRVRFVGNGHASQAPIGSGQQLSWTVHADPEGV